MSRQPIDPAPAPPGWALECIEAFVGHLERERDRSAHTIRAYAGDVRACLAWCAADGADDLGDVTLQQLRAWLGELSAGGTARATLSRRSAAVRTFFAWARRSGRVEADPALRLTSPKRQRTLPDVLSRESATANLEAMAAATVLASLGSDPLPAALTVGNVALNWTLVWIGNFIGGGLLIGGVCAWLNNGPEDYRD